MKTILKFWLFCKTVVGDLTTFQKIYFAVQPLIGYSVFSWTGVWLWCWTVIVALVAIFYFKERYGNKNETN